MELETILTNLSDAGCGEEDLRYAERLYRSGDTAALIRCFRKCRCSRIAEMHESQRKVDLMDYLIRQAAKAFAQKTM